MVLTKEQIIELTEAAKPLVRVLSDFHPHVKVIVEGNGFEFVEGIASRDITEFIKD